MAKKISGRGRRRSRNEKGNQGVGNFRFINIVQIFSIYCCFFYFVIFFLYLFYPRHLPTPTPTTHDPRPTTSTHYPRPTTFSYTHYRCCLRFSYLAPHWKKKYFWCSRFCEVHSKVKFCFLRSPLR